MWNLALKLSAVVIAILIAVLMVGMQYGVGIGIRTVDNMFVDVGTAPVVSWLIVGLAVIEVITLVVLFFFHRPAGSSGV